MAAFLDICRFNPTAGGTTDWTVSSAVTGYQTPANAGAVNGTVYRYRAESADLTQWELGGGAWNSGTGVLARTTVLFNSSGTTSKINFTAAPQVAVVGLKEDFISISEANSFTAAEQRQARNNIGVGPNSTVSANQVFAGPSSGAAADPAFRALVGAEAAMVLLGTATASSSASVSFTGLAGASYSELYLVLDGIVPATNATNLKIQISTGSGFLASGYRHGTFRWTNAGTGVAGVSVSDSGWVISSNSETLGTGANQSVSFGVHIYGPENATPLKRANWMASGLFSSSTYVYMSGGGEVDTNSAAIDGVKLLLDTGNIASGFVRLYGLRNS